MHGALEDGTLYVSCQCLLVRLKAKLGWGTDRLERFLRADWDFPKATARKMRNIWHIFDRYARDHMDNRIKFKSTASELLGMYVLLRHWVLTVVSIHAAVDLADEIAAFTAQCRVIDLIMTLKKGFADQTCSGEILAELQTAIDDSLRLHIATYGTETVRPKHHRMHHIPLQIARDKWVVDAFTMERLHLVVKESFSYLRNHADFEGSLLRGSMLGQIERLQDKLFFGLLGRKVPIKKLERLQTELTNYMASPVVTMLPVIHQSEVATILQDVPTTARQGTEAIDANATKEPQSFAKVDTLIAKVESYNWRTI